MQVVAEYVDTSGVTQNATADNTTTPTISGVAPFSVFFDASGSRSEDPNADDEIGAWMYMNYRFNIGTGATGTWSISGMQKNQIEGAPIAGFVFEVAGTHTVTVTVRDTEGRQGSITMTVEVSAPGAGATINTGGSWPAWASGGVYNLAAGTDHSAKGAINLNGLHNVLIRKTGAGADPIVSSLNWDTRTNVDSVAARTRGCRIDGINVGAISESPIGHLYCSVLNHGGSFYYNSTPVWWYWQQASTTTQKNNMCYPRGAMFWNCNEITSGGDNYVFIWTAKNLTIRNCDLNKTAGDGGQHVFRGTYSGLDLRGNRFRSAVVTMSYNKIHGFNNGSTFDAWRSDDRFGLAGGAGYEYVTRQIAIENNIYGAAGSNNNVGTNIELMPENDDAGEPRQGVELASVQGNVWYVSTNIGMATSFGGRGIVYSNNRLNMGAGSGVAISTSSRTNRIPVGWDGPYLSSARPTFV